MNRALPRNLLLAALTLPTVAACSGDGGGTAAASSSSSGGSSSSSSSSSSSGGAGNYTAQQLAAARAALPRSSVLAAPNPRGTMTPSPVTRPTIGANAEYPGVAAPIVHGVNAQVRGILDGLRAVGELPPTFYNSTTKEFVWGPYPDDDTALLGDTVTVYVREKDPPADFKWEYALIRGMGQDTATMRAVIWGGANPDANNPDHGAGVTLWDLEANNAFADAHDPNHAPLGRGRFVALYMHGPDEQTPSSINTIVVASFHQFVTAENPDALPINLDHLYGHVNDTANSVVYDFVDIQAQANIHNESAAVLEDLSLRLAFVNGGIGRGEAVVTGGDLNGAVVNGVECWDLGVNRTHANMTATGLGSDGGVSVILAEGAPADCGETFSQTLTDLGVPSLQSVPAELMAALRSAAMNGIPPNP